MFERIGIMGAVSCFCQTVEAQRLLVAAKLGKLKENSNG